jgi:hypothetical protein
MNGVHELLTAVRNLNRSASSKGLLISLGLSFRGFDISRCFVPCWDLGFACERSFGDALLRGFLGD